VPCSAGNILAYKALIADANTGGLSVKRGNTSSQGLESGSYTFWQDSGIGVGAPVPRPATTARACLEACDEDNLCAAVLMGASSLPITLVPASTITACDLLHGNSTQVTGLRSVTRVVIDRLSPSSSNGKEVHTIVVVIFNTCHVMLAHIYCGETPPELRSW
jgi:hypothetical protein